MSKLAWLDRMVVICARIAYLLIALLVIASVCLVDWLISSVGK